MFHVFERITNFPIMVITHCFYNGKSKSVALFVLYRVVETVKNMGGIKSRFIGSIGYGEAILLDGYVYNTAWTVMSYCINNKIIDHAFKKRAVCYDVYRLW